MALAATDFKALTDSALKRFSAGMAAADPKICWEFDMEVARLESQVIQIYGMAALMARHETELEKVAEIWGAVIQVCDEVSQRIRGLCQEHPACRTSLDKILDIRNKAARLRDLHQ